MAVVDKYVDSEVEAGKKAAGITLPTSVVACKQVVSVAAADDDGSVYRVFPNLSGNLVPVLLLITNSAITSGTDYDIGFYDANGGAVVDKDELADGLDFSSAGANINGLAAATAIGANGVDNIYTLLGKTLGSDTKGGYDLCITANTVGSAAGTIVVQALFINPNAS